MSKSVNHPTYIGKERFLKLFTLDYPFSKNEQPNHPNVEFQIMMKLGKLEMSILMKWQFTVHMTYMTWNSHLSQCTPLGILKTVFLQ